MTESGYGYRVDTAILAEGNRIGHELAARANTLASALGGVFSELAAAAGENALSGALSDAGSVTAQRMGHTVTMFAQIGDQLSTTARTYQQTEDSGTQCLTGIEGDL
jgi:hypothetical protein